MIKIKVVNRGHQQLPAYATPQSAGMDLRANLSEPITLHPMERRLIPTGLHIALPEGYEAQVRPRSGLALKHGLTVLNTPTCRKRTSSSTMASALPRWSSPVMSRETSLSWRNWTRRSVVKEAMVTQV